MIEDTPTPGFLPGLIASGLMVLISITCLVIAWIIWARNRHPYLLYFAISMTVFFLVTLFFTFVFFTNFSKNKKVKYHVKGDPLYDIAFILLFICGVLFLVTGLFILIYRPFHFNQMRKELSTDKWKKSWGNSFESEWASDKRILTALGIMAMTIALLSFICCLNMYSNVLDKADLSQLLIYVSLLIASVFSWVALREYFRIRENEIELGGEHVLW